MSSLATAVIAIMAGSLAPNDSTETIASHYLELTFQQQYDALRDVYAADVFFVDPTGDYWGGTLADGVRGREAVIELQKSWGLTSADFEIQEKFAVGEYALFRGVLTWTTGNNPEGVTTDFMTVIRIVHGKVAERHDYGNYQRVFPGSPETQHNATTTEAIGTTYFRAYLDQERDRMQTMYGVPVSFQDPTAAFFGAASGKRVDGGEAIIANMNRAFEPITAFEFYVEGSWVSNHHVVFLGRCRYTLAAAALGTAQSVTFEHSAVFVITVVDGKVVAHRDFVDYSTFREQLAEARG
jgi:ketosteroid isomerase-like protein